MSTANRALVRRYFDELLNRGEVSLAHTLFTPDVAFYPAGAPEPIRGVPALTTFLAKLGAAFSDARFVTGDEIVEGDRVVSGFTFHGRHTGEYNGIPATGRRIAVPGVDVFRIVDGRIAEIRVHLDTLGLLMQLGVIAPAAGAAPAEANKALVRRYLERVVSGGDLAAADELVAPDVTFTSPYTPEPIRGIEGFKAMIGGLHGAFPDMRLREEDVVAEGDLVATRWTVSGTHLGPFGPLAATGRRFSITGMSFYRVAGGRIVEGWVNDDNLGMAEQLGARDATPAAEYAG